MFKFKPVKELHIQLCNCCSLSHLQTKNWALITKKKNPCNILYKPIYKFNEKYVLQLSATS